MDGATEKAKRGTPEVLEIQAAAPNGTQEVSVDQVLETVDALPQTPSSPEFVLHSKRAFELIEQQLASMRPSAPPPPPQTRASAPPPPPPARASVRPPPPTIQPVEIPAAPATQPRLPDFGRVTPNANATQEVSADQVLEAVESLPPPQPLPVFGRPLPSFHFDIPVDAQPPVRGPLPRVAPPPSIAPVELPRIDPSEADETFKLVRNADAERRRRAKIVVAVLAPAAAILLAAVVRAAWPVASPTSDATTTSAAIARPATTAETKPAPTTTVATATTAAPQKSESTVPTVSVDSLPAAAAQAPAIPQPAHAFAPAAAPAEPAAVAEEPAAPPPAPVAARASSSCGAGYVKIGSHCQPIAPKRR